MIELFDSNSFTLLIITLVLFSLDYTVSGICFLIITIYYVKLNQLFYNRIQRKKNLVNGLFIQS